MNFFLEKNPSSFSHLAVFKFKHCWEYSRNIQNSLIWKPPCRNVFVMRCAVWYHHLYNLKTVEACNFTKITTPPWVFFTFFQLYIWYQIAQPTTFGTLLNLHDEEFLRNNEQLKAVNYFCKNDPSEMFYKVLSTSLLWTTICSQLFL